MMCWGGRAFEAVTIWIMLWPEEMTREWLQSIALPLVVGNLAEVGTNALAFTACVFGYLQRNYTLGTRAPSPSA